MKKKKNPKHNGKDFLTLVLISGAGFFLFNRLILNQMYFKSNGVAVTGVRS